MPGIEAAGIIDGLPLTLNISNSGVLMEGKPEPSAADTPLAAMYYITPGYLHAMGTRLSPAATWIQRDTKDAPPVALVNDMLRIARQLLRLLGRSRWEAIPTQDNREMDTNRRRSGGRKIPLSR